MGHKKPDPVRAFLDWLSGSGSSSKKRRPRERLVGGRADYLPDSRFDQAALRKGIGVEMEHTSSPAVAKEIAKDHLTEDPRYYDALEKMERRLEQTKPRRRRRS